MWKTKRLLKKIDKKIFNMELLILTFSIRRNLSESEMRQELMLPSLLERLHICKTALQEAQLKQRHILNYL
jgi:hypothetical protein